MHTTNISDPFPAITKTPIHDSVSLRYQYQDIIDPHRGDCESVALACLLGIPKLSVPKFAADAYDICVVGGRFEGCDITDREPKDRIPLANHLARKMRDAWLRNGGYRLLSLQFNTIRDYRVIDGIRHLAIVESLNYATNVCYHAVVGTFTKIGDATHFAIEHDPAERNKGRYTHNGVYHTVCVEDRESIDKKYRMVPAGNVKPVLCEFLFKL